MVLFLVILLGAPPSDVEQPRLGCAALSTYLLLRSAHANITPSRVATLLPARSQGHNIAEIVEAARSLGYSLQVERIADRGTLVEKPQILHLIAVR